MDVLIMAGGMGTRLKKNIEKPLLKISGKPMIDYIMEAVLNSNIEKIRISVSKHTPNTKIYIENNYINTKKYNQRVEIIHTSGIGYINDLNECIEYFKEPFLILTSDIPTIKSKTINSIINEYLIINNSNNPIESLCAVTLKENYIGTPTIDIKGYIPLGLNIISPKYGEQTEMLYLIDEKIVNVNTLIDKNLVENIIKKGD
ncbi:5'-deoxyadenosylcobinamide phosphate nucleotidyltransferase [Methanococcus vannielii SB]|uniref:5'-deoxyadenosylcobinamide phosphate nucleotidyltransferase n=1 Tax=Methanococcus vannielii (strain ATCC 35089 / DSM 1224 / JCM 13029 / OCM 148 / SB) TaxID=406327 RepID=A6UN49_METVS|nr:adenosylcobinamide-phosphate guanylyltransferase [Methanococcus vannielii]ABR53921.1 5'-deoxyadenosylcobinamide phosphate nucleotidyltransferase [Methanococcus vannielii SB]